MKNTSYTQFLNIKVPEEYSNVPKFTIIYQLQVLWVVSSFFKKEFSSNRDLSRSGRSKKFTDYQNHNIWNFYRKPKIFNKLIFSFKINLINMCFHKTLNARSYKTRMCLGCMMKTTIVEFNAQNTPLNSQ